METGTFELRGNDMIMRVLTDAEINEVAGGVGAAAVSASQTSGAGSTLATNGSVVLNTANTAATAIITANSIVATGANNLLTLAAAAAVA